MTQLTSIEKRIFISHINEEASLAIGLKQNIEKSFEGRCTVFVSSDPTDLPAGTRWLEEINQALETASLLIILCSSHSILRPWINFEAGCCWNRKIPILPVCHSGQQRDTLPSPLSSFQSLELKHEKFSELLIQALSSHLEIESTPQLDYLRLNSDLAIAISVDRREPSRQQPLRPILKKDGNLELARVLEQQERTKRANQMVKQMLPSPLKIEFDGENSVKWIERPHPAFPGQQVRHKVYEVVIHNSTSHDVDNVTVELERIEDLTSQHLVDKKTPPYIGHKLSFERNGKNIMKFSPDLRDSLKLISHGTGIMMGDSFQIEGNDNYCIDAQHHHRIFLKVTGDGVKPSKATFIVQLDGRGIFRMTRENKSLSPQT